ncbi:uncharacterized protein LOC109415217 [Aedes albopictus]|uniref:Anaphase-promoting complex subunit CDC26 n=1 Tax=Aedes albopictus TaxID=7160 RepID=A0ABM1ZX73_AEDAL|nr:uncharacterized protein LOC109415217 [Aedes albopictus]
MRRREIQSFTLKLSDLKEYDAAKQQRLAARANKDGSTAAGSTTVGPDEVDPMKTPEVTMSTLPKLGGEPKTKQEIRARIGFPTDLALE